MWTYLYYKDVTITLDTEALKSKSSVYANWDQVLSIQYIQYMPSQFVFFFGGGGGCLTKDFFEEKGGFLNCSNFRLSLEIKHYDI